MLRRLYDWTYNLAQHPHAFWALAAVSFIESSIFPIPPDVLLIPIILANRDRAFYIAGICTAASVLGGAFGYGIGMYGYEFLGKPIIEFYGYQDAVLTFNNLFNKWGLWLVAIAGFTPFPYKVITITSGVTHLDFIPFMIVSVLARGARFYFLAILLWYFGPAIERFIHKYFNWLAFAFFAMLAGGFLVFYRVL